MDLNYRQADSPHGRGDLSLDSTGPQCPLCCGATHSALGQRPFHLLQQVVQKRAVTALAVDRHGLVALRKGNNAGHSETLPGDCAYLPPISNTFLCDGTLMMEGKGSGSPPGASLSRQEQPRRGGLWGLGTLPGTGAVAELGGTG